MNSRDAEQGTKQAGYEENGPYHCGDCIHVRGSICIHPEVVSDPALKSQRKGQGVEVDRERGCCKYVNQSSNLKRTLKS